MIVPTFQVLPTVLIFQNVMRANADHGFIYLNNPKVGCSTIKAALWQGVRGPGTAPEGEAVHVVRDSPFDNNPADAAAAARAFVFTFVRNPFQRLVSAYLNKVAGHGRREWLEFAARQGVTGPVSFDRFVEVIAGVPAEFHDPHWRPQHLNTLYPFIQPNLLCDLDSLDQMLPDIQSRLFPDQPLVPVSKAARSHATAARQTWRDYLTDPATVARICTVYAGDFAGYGYAPDIKADPAAAQAVIRSDHRHHGLSKLVAYREAPGREKYEALGEVGQADQMGALSDWILAQRLRLIAQNRVRALQMLTDSQAQIAVGPDYLQRIAEEVRAGKGMPGARMS